MGHARVTTPGLTVHGVDSERGYLLIKGAVPGPDGGLVLVRSAAKRPAPADAEPPADAAVTTEEASA
jgi:large subunit ribosomal protein L3